MTAKQEALTWKSSKMCKDRVQLRLECCILALCMCVTVPGGGSSGPLAALGVSEPYLLENALCLLGRCPPLYPISWSQWIRGRFGDASGQQAIVLTVAMNHPPPTPYCLPLNSMNDSRLCIFLICLSVWLSLKS